jgi:acyl carrier protein
MAITKQDLEELIKKQVVVFCEENDYEVITPDNKTQLIGSNAAFDSMGLVSFLVELEEEIEDQYDIEIEIADEKAMSRFRSPFMNIDTLSEFLLEKINAD